MYPAILTRFSLCWFLQWGYIIPCAGAESRRGKRASPAKHFRFFHYLVFKCWMVECFLL